MAIRNSAFPMLDDLAAALASDFGWGSSDGWWSIANLGIDLGSDGQSSDLPPRVGEIPPSVVEDPPPGRIVDAGPFEPDQPPDRPSLGLPNPPSGDSDTPPTSDGGPPPDRNVDVPPPEPTSFPGRPGPP